MVLPEACGLVRSQLLCGADSLRPLGHEYCCHGLIIARIHLRCGCFVPLAVPQVSVLETQPSRLSAAIRCLGTIVLVHAVWQRECAPRRTGGVLSNAGAASAPQVIFSSDRVLPSYLSHSARMNSLLPFRINGIEPAFPRLCHV